VTKEESGEALSQNCRADQASRVHFRLRNSHPAIHSALLSSRIHVVLDTDANIRPGHTFACLLTGKCEGSDSVSMQRGRETDVEWIHGTCFRVLWEA